MMQANPQLTPNAVKAILQYTAEVYAGYDALTEGAGFLNAKGAVALARQFVTGSTKLPADATRWSGAVTWGNRLMKGGLVTASANAWPSGVRWGAERTDNGLRIELGVRCESDELFHDVDQMGCRHRLRLQRRLGIGVSRR